MQAGAGGNPDANASLPRPDLAEAGSDAGANGLSAPAQRTVKGTGRFYGKLPRADASPL